MTPIGADREMGLATAPGQAPPLERASSITRLIVIDHEPGVAQVLRRRAVALGWQERVLSAPLPLEELTQMHPSAVVIDVVTCGEATWAYLEAIARSMPDAVLIVFTARSTVAERVRGLRVGADDWITKPAHPEEVIARVQAALRRKRGGADRKGSEPILAGELEISPAQFQAFVGEQSVDLTRREFELLDLLARADDRVLEREEIYGRVWGYAMARGDRSVDVFVGRIRSKLAAVSPGWSYIRTHVGVGYRFVAELKANDRRD
jgi:DNA-binding response OmpR family regulator